MKVGSKVTGDKWSSRKNEQGTVTAIDEDWDDSGQWAPRYSIKWDNGDEEESVYHSDVRPLSGHEEVKTKLQEAFKVVQEAQTVANSHGYDLSDYDDERRVILSMVEEAGWSSSSMLC